MLRLYSRRSTIDVKNWEGPVQDETGAPRIAPNAVCPRTLLRAAPGGARRAHDL
jgi:hypothetical protein